MKNNLFVLLLFIFSFVAEVYAKDIYSGQDVKELESVLVKGSRVENTLENIPDEKIVITAEELAIQNPQNVLEAIQWIPGLTLKSSFYGHGNSSDSQKINGYSEALVLIDGNPASGAYSLSEISASNIERIEIIKGANSLAYGSGALGGVINIITKQAADKFTFSLKGTYSTRKQNSLASFKPRRYKKVDFNSNTQDVNIGFKLGNLRQLYTYGRSYVEGNKYSMDSFQGKFGIDLDKVRLGLNAKAVMNEQGWLDRTEDDYTGGLNMDWEIDPYSSLTVNAFLRNSETSYTMGRYNIKEDRLYDEEKIVYTRRIGNNLLSAGWQRTGDHLDFSDFKSWSRSQDVNSFFVSDEFSLTENFSIIPALRVDFHSKWNEQVNPKLGILWKATDSLKFRASWGRALKVPALDQLYQKIYHPHGYWLDGNPDLRPEESNTVRVGIENRFGQDFWMSVSFFRNEFKNNIGLKTLNEKRLDRPIYGYENNERAMTQGIDSELRYYITDTLSAGIGYSWAEGKNKATGERLKDIMKHRVTPMIRYYSEQSGLTAEIRGEYQAYPYLSKTENIKGIKKENYSFHASLSKNITDYAKIWINGYNLLNETKRYGLEGDGRKIVVGLEIKY